MKKAKKHNLDFMCCSFVLYEFVLLYKFTLFTFNQVILYVQNLKSRNAHMSSIYLEHPSGRVHGLQFGSGQELLIALHGFGDRARLFTRLGAEFTDQYTVVAVDLPFHGATEWQKTSFDQADMVEILRQITLETGHQEYSLMGFSFGARIAQAMLPALSPQLRKLYLISPDGAHTKGLRLAALTPVWFRKFMIRRLQSPAWFIKMVEFARKLRLLPEYMDRFLMRNLKRPDRLNRTFGCWLSLDHFVVSSKSIRRQLQQARFLTEVHVGETDPYLRSKDVQAVYGDLPNVKLVWHAKGHDLL